MTYAEKDQSVQDGQPVFLYTFAQGATVWNYTNQAENLTVDAVTYTASAISHSEVTQSNEMAKDPLRLTLPRTHELAQRFLQYGPDKVTTLTLRRGHTTDADEDYIVAWKGRIASTRVTGSTFSIECESVFTSMRRPGLRARYQRSCRHALYQRGCRLDKEDWAVAGFVESMPDATTVVVAAAATQPDGWFVGGMLEMADEAARFITGHVGDTLTLVRPFVPLSQAVAGAGYGLNYGNLYGGVPVNLYPGCDHAQSTCNTKFSNGLNYGGFKYIPIINPFGGGSIA